MKEKEIAIPFLLGQFLKITYVVSTLQVFLIAKKYALNIDDSIAIEIFGLFSFILLQIFLSSRACIIYLFVEFCVVYIFLLQNRSLDVSTGIKKILLYGIFFLISFYCAGIVIGRGVLKHDFFYYLSIYSGSSIAIFTEYLNCGYVDITFWGNDTFFSFPGFDRVLGYLGIESSSLPYEDAFVYVDGKAIGNVCPGYFYWLYDLGIIGIIIYSVIQSIFFNYLYFRCRLANNVKELTIWLLLYSSVSYAMLMFCVADYFYRFIVSMNQISFVIIFLLLDFVLYNKVKIKF